MAVSPYASSPLAEASAGSSNGPRQQRPTVPPRRRSKGSPDPEIPTTFREMAIVMDKRETQKMLRRLKKSRTEPAILPKIVEPDALELPGETLLKATSHPAANESPRAAAAEGKAKPKRCFTFSLAEEAETVEDVVEEPEKHEDSESEDKATNVARVAKNWGKVKAKAQLIEIVSAFSKASQDAEKNKDMMDTMQLWRRWCNKTDRGFKPARSQYPAWKDPDFLTKEINELEVRLQRDRVRMRKQMEQQVHKSKEGLKITAQHLPAVAGELNAEVVSRYRKDALERIDTQGKRIRQAIRDSTMRRKELEACVQTMKTTFGKQPGEDGRSNTSFLETLKEARMVNREAKNRTKMLDSVGRRRNGSVLEPSQMNGV